MTAAIPTNFPVSSFIGVTVTSTRGGKADIGQPLLIDLDTNEDRHRVAAVCQLRASIAAGSSIAVAAGCAGRGAISIPARQFLHLREGGGCLLARAHSLARGFFCSRFEPLTVRKDFSSKNNDQQSTVGAALRYIPLQKGQHLNGILGWPLGHPFFVPQSV